LSSLAGGGVLVFASAPSPPASSSPSEGETLFSYGPLFDGDVEMTLSDSRIFCLICAIEETPSPGADTISSLPSNLESRIARKMFITKNMPITMMAK